MKHPNRKWLVECVEVIIGSMDLEGLERSDRFDGLRRLDGLEEWIDRAHLLRQSFEEHADPSGKPGEDRAFERVDIPEGRKQA